VRVCIAEHFLKFASTWMGSPSWQIFSFSVFSSRSRFYGKEEHLISYKFMIPADTVCVVMNITENVC